ncbi:MAG: hypothetical protein ACR2MA_06260 [Egibacteraceae bacterium]
MVRLTALYVDFTCVDSYRIWRWVSRLPDPSTVEVRPFPNDAEERGSPWDRQVGSVGMDLLALGELAREQGADVHQRYVPAVFRTMHDDPDAASSVEEWLRLAAELGLDLGAFTADPDRWRAEVGLWHAEAKDELGVTGVPTLVFEGASRAARAAARRSGRGPG